MKNDNSLISRLKSDRLRMVALLASCYKQPVVYNKDLIAEIANVQTTIEAVAAVDAEQRQA